MKFLQRFFVLVFSLILALPIIASIPSSALAAASLYVSNPANVTAGDTVSISIYVNTGGQSANAFEGTLSYPANLFDGVRGTYSGSICSLPVTQPDPSGGSATFSCGTPSGFNGTGLVATVVLTAKAIGSGSLGLSGCQVLANDGRGTDITGGCSGSSITVTGAPVSTATPTVVPTAATPTPTPKPKGPTPTPPPSKGNQTPTPAENPKNNTPAPTPSEAAPAAQALPSSTPTPSTTPSATPSGSPPPQEKRSISNAFRDMFAAFKSFRTSQKDFSGVIALLLTLIPFLAFLLAIVYLLYRLYMLERRRRRTLDRLFELELSELSALEGKMDLLTEKGSKGRAQYQEEFKQAKENILRQLRPDYGKPVDSAPPPAAEKS